jgi:hypothetical protein
MRYLFIFIFIHSIAFAQLVPVEIVKSETGYQLLRGGEPYYIKGVGGLENLEKAKEYGANSFRTWSADNAKMYLDKAQELGLTVCLGFWAQHERHGFDWSNELGIKLQLEKFAKVVDEVKDHPALLMWAVGNEVDLFYSNFDVWKHINDIALMIKSKDPHHPVTTVTAGLDVAEVKLIQKYAPALDLLGVNTYGGLGFALESLPYYGWDKSYMITEWGPNGHWESPKTDWGIPIEQTSTEKAKSYKERYEMIFADSTNCLGSYVFLWGFKQETTSSWYGLFLKDGTQTSVMDVLIEKWSGKKPKNLAPDLNAFTINSQDAYQNVKLDKRSPMQVDIDAYDPNDDKLSYHIEIVPESTDTKAGGDFERAPTAVFQKVFSKSSFTIKAPSKSGKYRLFVVIKDGEKGATANIPFLVN